VVVTGLRARVRLELTDEIKRLARQQLDSVGASELSLRAIARDMDMASSAMYRYFPSRDDLLTALIIDAYNALGDVAEAADAAHQRSSIKGRFIAIGLAAYEWAKAHRAEYGLIYGTPVPGYKAPTDTIGPAIRFAGVLVRLLADGIDDGSVINDATSLPRAVRRDMTAINVTFETSIPEPVMARGVQAWSALFGTISFTLFGHLHNVVSDYDTYLRHSLDVIATRMIEQ
jgi:AcrR family transcriptional regulator